MQDRGELTKNAEGYWVEGPALDWEILPARAEAAIAERIGRLAQPLRAALQVASVEGEDFTAEVVARVLGTDEREIVQRLSRDLDRRHRLVRPRGVDRLGIRRISRYRFRNYLFQRYLYDNLDEIERAYLHEEVGNTLEELHGEQAGDIVVQLAWHFQEAGIAEKAIEYLSQAGEKALRLTAYKEAIAHLTKGLLLLLSLPDSRERAEQELRLQLGLGIAFQCTKSIRSAEVLESYTRAQELSVQTGKTAQLCEVVGQIAVIHYVGAEYQTAREIATEALTLAHRAGDPLLVSLGHWYLGFISFALGEFTTARAHLEEVISFYEPHLHHHAFVVHGGKDAGLGAMAYDACCLWCLGYPEQALKRSQEALALARELDSPFSLADVLCFAGCKFNEMRRNAAELKDNAEEIIRLANDKVEGWQGTGTCYRGEALTMQGQLQEGIKQIREGLTYEQSIGILCCLSGTRGILALAQAQAGQLDEGLNTLAETLTLVEATDERYLEPELHRLRAELLLMQDHEADAEASLLKAVEVARRQHARSWELRATITLAHLWQRQGRAEEARQLLMQIYVWFTEGFDTPDLKEAKALLEELSQVNSAGHGEK
jgi:predicted ATPase